MRSYCRVNRRNSCSVTASKTDPVTTVFGEKTTYRLDCRATFPSLSLMGKRHALWQPLLIKDHQPTSISAAPKFLKIRDKESKVAEFLALKHDSRILGHSSNPVCGFSMMEQVRPCGVWPFLEPYTGFKSENPTFVLYSKDHCFSTLSTLTIEFGQHFESYKYII